MGARRPCMTGTPSRSSTSNSDSPTRGRGADPTPRGAPRRVYSKRSAHRVRAATPGTVGRGSHSIAREARGASSHTREAAERGQRRDTRLRHHSRRHRIERLQVWDSHPRSMLSPSSSRCRAFGRALDLATISRSDQRQPQRRVTVTASVRGCVARTLASADTSIALAVTICTHECTSNASTHEERRRSEPPRPPLPVPRSALPSVLPASCVLLPGLPSMACMYTRSVRIRLSVETASYRWCRGGVDPHLEASRSTIRVSHSSYAYDRKRGYRS
jgi:hypothetical protein